MARLQFSARVDDEATLLAVVAGATASLESNCLERYSSLKQPVVASVCFSPALNHFQRIFNALKRWCCQIITCCSANRNCLTGSYCISFSLACWSRIKISPLSLFHLIQLCEPHISPTDWPMELNTAQMACLIRLNMIKWTEIGKSEPDKMTINKRPFGRVKFKLYDCNRWQKVVAVVVLIAVAFAVPVIG